MTYPDGRVFEGAYKDGKRNGHGKMTYSDGRSLKAHTKMASANGPGKMTYPDGRVFEGEYQRWQRRMATERRLFLMEESLKANTKMAVEWPRKDDLS